MSLERAMSVLEVVNIETLKKEKPESGRMTNTVGAGKPVMIGSIKGEGLDEKQAVITKGNG